jgi:very-short-patch-repair endonuclease
MAMNGNPGDAAVACLIEGKTYARNVGQMSNCRAAIFSVELPLDIMPSVTFRLIHCSGVSGLGEHRKYIGHRDDDVCARVLAKLKKSQLVFVRKEQDKRYPIAKAAAKRCLDSGCDTWTPSPLETDDALSSMIENKAATRTESPVESDLFCALRKWFPEASTYAPDEARQWYRVPALSGAFGVLVPQLKVGEYRADFAVVSDSAQLIVEVDGYAYHDTTRDQLEHDRQRDRYLMRAGWRVVRFTGREVHRDPDACARELIETLKGIE